MNDIPPVTFMIGFLQSLLGAGIVGAVVTALGWRAQRKTLSEIEKFKHTVAETLAARARRADYLREQITNLYGPLGFFFEASSQYWTMSGRIHKRYGEYFKDRHGSHFQEEASQAIGTANRYGELMVENNKAAIAVLRENWGWLDQDDRLDAGDFLLDVARHTVEVEGGQKLPLGFHDDSNSEWSIKIMRPKFVERLVRKLQEKQVELSGLTA